jgi:antibiotic biosynthesis monooxygenase (ABM) superfamily enzyme
LIAAEDDQSDYRMMQDYIKEKLAHYRWETNIAVSFTVFIVSIMINLFLGGTAVSPVVRYSGISLVLIAILTLFAYIVRRGLDQKGLIEKLKRL